ncbi:LysR family transcriptional regulator [Sphingomonas sp. CGMCC 1.13654]|uniref:LysR family transcriptional regulator n=1 Tax=Sphingomonas chungangi TaxID=2683589 RepID=A0A838L1Y8_9SPHN|nr:LysR family transcriptional regulator [Sphingomonas chungangi]MBA2933204.1 LysR family transcriptional regulator [Sphingomonas chungangi]MVW57876.1 LysR family transcriptional regulator [Sphingomonas chungangi]
MAVTAQDMEIAESGVQPLNTRSPGRLPDGIRWDDLRVALVLEEAKSFRQAAEKIGVTINTVRARLDRLEAAVGLRLFRRSPKGVTATAACIDLLSAAKQISKGLDSLDIDDTPPLIVPGEIRIGASEALGVLWLAPRLGALQDRLQSRAVHLNCSYDLERDRSFEVDIEVGFRRSENPDRICARLATTHFMLFASRAYLARMGTPRTLGELTSHRLVAQIAPGVNSQILDFLVGTGHEMKVTPLRMNSGMALLTAIERGEGIALMPTYVMALSRGLVPLDLPVQLRFDIFLTYAADLRNTRPIVETVRWLREIFQPADQPWFAEPFVHPDAMTDAIARMTEDELDSGIR